MKQRLILGSILLLVGVVTFRFVSVAHANYSPDWVAMTQEVMSGGNGHVYLNNTYLNYYEDDTSDYLEGLVVLPSSGSSNQIANAHGHLPPDEGYEYFYSYGDWVSYWQKGWEWSGWPGTSFSGYCYLLD